MKKLKNLKLFVGATLLTVPAVLSTFSCSRETKSYETKVIEASEDTLFDEVKEDYYDGKIDVLKTYIELSDKLYDMKDEILPTSQEVVAVSCDEIENDIIIYNYLKNCDNKSVSEERINDLKIKLNLDFKYANEYIYVNGKKDLKDFAQKQVQATICAIYDYNDYKGMDYSFSILNASNGFVNLRYNQIEKVNNMNVVDSFDLTIHNSKVSDAIEELDNLDDSNVKKETPNYIYNSFLNEYLLTDIELYENLTSADYKLSR